MDKTYLGDGVYATFDGYQVWLTTERENGEHKIAIDPYVMACLEEYYRAAVQKQRSQDEP